MPFDSNGNFTRIHNWEDDRKNDIDIVSDRHDAEDDGFADGLSECLLKDGRASMEGNLKLGGFQIKNMANGTSSGDAVNKGQLENSAKNMTARMNTLFCLGDIKASLQKTNHNNWFLCNGQAVSRTTYADLFALIGTNFGAGDGTTTFNLPDYRGKFLRGLGGDAAENMYTTQAEGLPNITGTVAGAYGETKGGVQDGAFRYTETGGLQDGGDSADGERIRTSNISFNASLSNSIYGASAHVTPINQAVNYFIKVMEE